MTQRTAQEAKAVAILLGGRVVETDRVRVCVPRPTNRYDSCADCAFVNEVNEPGTTCYVLINDPGYYHCEGVIWIEVP